MPILFFMNAAIVLAEIPEKAFDQNCIVHVDHLRMFKMADQDRYQKINTN